MKAIEIVGIIKKEKPELLGEVTDKRAAAVIREAFVLLAKKLDDQAEGLVRVPGFGSFQVRLVNKDKDGAQIPVKRIMFRPAQAASETSEKKVKSKRVKRS